MERQVDLAVAAGRPVRVTVRCKASGQLVPLVLRPAGTDQLAPEKPIGALFCVLFVFFCYMVHVPK